MSPFCMQTMDKFGDHALCCKRTGDMIARHNGVRNWLFKLSDIARLNPEMEKLGLLGPGTNLGDVRETCPSRCGTSTRGLLLMWR